MDRLSDGESEHEEYNYNEDGGKSNDSDSSESDEGPLLVKDSGYAKHPYLSMIT